ncbi:ABC transporter ATP-binding protein [Candidatus Defluviicoccus seviourii]|uniref:ABC transporter ATP-binding protein n=1 Tax=Candidatus Defluviicoccus seviourii TaxID=2565273 RepID=A0A564WHG9_9PROT|nr:ABC transporter ATP-binding protein [Candidatus Defluviicoccus seviourii]
MAAVKRTTVNPVLQSALKRTRAGVLYAALLGSFISALHLILPLYMVQVYDRVVPGRSLDTLIVLTLLAVAGLSFLGLMEYIRARVFMIVGERLARQLGAPVLQAAVAQSLRSQSTVATDAMRDVHELRQFVTGGPVALPFDALVSPLFLLLLFVLHPTYGVVGVIAVAILISLSVAMEYVARRPQASANDAAVRSHVEVGAAIRNAEIIEALGMRAAIASRWRQGQDRALMLVGAGNTAAKAISAVARSLRMMVQIAMLATGATLLISHQVSAGSMMAATIMLGRLLQPFDQLIQGWRQWCLAFGAFARLKQLLAGHVSDRLEVPAVATEGTVVIERLSFIPPGSDQALLKGISFSLTPGEVLGIIGPSGAGKSTLARLLVGVWKPSAGGIYLDGHDVYAWERTSFGRAVGYLPQNAALLEGTVRDNIGRFADAELADVITAAKAAGVHEMIGRLPRGYETVIGEGAFVLSGGQRQRIALARALFGGPRLLVLDEPNSSMDAEGEQALLLAIEQARRNGTTVVIVAQRTSVVATADRLLVLREGRIERIGPRREVAKDYAAPAPRRSVGPAAVARLPLTATA